MSWLRRLSTFQGVVAFHMAISNLAWLSPADGTAEVEVEVMCIEMVTYQLFTTHVLARLGHPIHRSARSLLGLPSRPPSLPS